jgi:hypothetical protein
VEVREVGWGVVEGRGRTFLLYVGGGEGSIEYIGMRLEYPGRWSVEGVFRSGLSANQEAVSNSTA